MNTQTLSLRTKRQHQDWFVKGRRTDYDLTKIKQIRTDIKKLKSKIQIFKGTINSLNSKTESEQKLVSITKQIKELEQSIDLDNHISFLSNWNIVGRASYGINMRAMANSREKINKVISDEFFGLKIEVTREITALKDSLPDLESKIETESIHNLSQIKPLELKIQDCLVSITQLELELNAQIRPLKNYLKA